MNDHAHGKLYTALKVEKQPGSLVSITGEVPADAVAEWRKRSLRAIVHDLALPGFRKGHVPEDMALAHVGEFAVLQRTAEHVLPHVYAHIVEDEGLHVVGQPNISITKLAPGNPIGFTITSAVYPEFSLPDYRSIAEKERGKHEDPDTVAVTDDEAHAELVRLRSMVHGAKPADANAPSPDADKDALPPIDDAFAQSLGEFRDLTHLMETVRTGMLADKRHKAQEKRRVAIADAIIAQTDVVVPALFVEGELDTMVSSFKDRVARAGLDLEHYLNEIQKTLEDLRKDWKGDAEKRAKLQLILHAVADKEGVKPDESRLLREVAHLKEHYTDVDEESVRTYVETQMTNEAVLNLLEGRRKEVPDEKTDVA